MGKNLTNNEERIQHPAFGQIRFGRVSGNQAFYGSQVNQQHYITMEIYESELERDLSHDFYFAKGKLLELRMTSNQFAELITSLNQGSGVPCTLEYVRGRETPNFEGEIETKNRATHRQFKQRLQTFADSLREKQILAKELVKKKTLSKDDQHKLTLHLDWLTGEIERNMPFFMEQFQETMDKVVLEAKSEVENAIQHKLTTVGIESMQQLKAESREHRQLTGESDDNSLHR